MTSKRPRGGVDGGGNGAPSPHRARPPQPRQQDQQAGFQFGFFDPPVGGLAPAGRQDTSMQGGGGGGGGAPSIQRRGPWGRRALLLPQAQERGANASAGGGEGAVPVRILWEESGGATLTVVKEEGEGDEGGGAGRSPARMKVDPLRLQPVPVEEAAMAAAAANGDDRSHLVEEHDLVFDADAASAPSPPPLGPATAALLYPVGPRRFMEEIYGRKALAIHAAGRRARRVAKDLMAGSGKQAPSSSSSSSVDLDLEALLASASRTVVWMKEKKAGPGSVEGSEEVQYLDDVPPAVAWACYRAGHSLYFNPPPEVQRPYIRGVLRELGMDLGMAATGEGGQDSLGGDMEVFAVQGRHTTPWHFDAQENITIQLRGLKKWTFGPSKLPDPVTNLHPSSSNRAALARDRTLHAACRPGVPTPSPPEAYEVASVVLRPGSVLYVPCGWWHRVESLGDREEEDGSLSINLSLDPPRWSDVLARQLGAVLWGRGERGRARLGDGGSIRNTPTLDGREVNVAEEEGPEGMAAARRRVHEVLHLLRLLLGQVAPEDLLPMAAFFHDDEDDEEDKDAEEAAGGAARGRRDTHVVVAVEAEDLDGEGSDSSSEEDEDEADGDARARARGSLHAQRGLSMAARWRYDWDDCGKRNPVAANTFARSVLAVLAVEEGDGSNKRATCFLHRGFAATPSAAPSPGVTVRIEVDRQILPALHTLAAMDPALPTSVWDLCNTMRGGGGLDRRDEGDDVEAYREALLRKLVGVLTYHGYLRPT